MNTTLPGPWNVTSTPVTVSPPFGAVSVFKKNCRISREPAKPTAYDTQT
jgi:hypothetical protein